ncbi:hypothetical protein Ae201684P_018885 [Aphanomyces euteiches]|nr:hypothetical protein Ae201684P_018885 [Aphanomyces euteiches]
MNCNSDSQPTSQTVRGRPVIRNAPKQLSKKFKNVHVTYKMKQLVIDTFDEVGMAATLDRHFSNRSGSDREVARKKVYKWLKQRDLIKQKASNAKTTHHKCARDIGMGTSLPRDHEKQLARWVSSMRKDGVPVTPQMLHMMALETVTDLGLDEHSFKASWHWMKAFKKRFGLALRSRTQIGQESQADGEAALSAFSRRVQEIVETEGIETIFNADQTAVNYEYLPTKTIHQSGDTTVWIKCGGKTKERETAMLLADSTGRKYPLFMVLRTGQSRHKDTVHDNGIHRHGFGKHVWKQVEPLQGQFNCQVYGNPTAWWNSSICVEFLKYHFEHRPDRMTKKILLLWDDFSGHFTDEVIACANELNIVLEKVPPRFTWICQPADVAWIRPTKTRLRQHWIDLIRQQVRSNKAQGSSFKLIPPSRSTILQ